MQVQVPCSTSSHQVCIHSHQLSCSAKTQNSFEILQHEKCGCWSALQYSYFQVHKDGEAFGKPLEEQLLPERENSFNCLSTSFQLSPQNSRCSQRHLPPSLPVSPYMQTALQILHVTEFTSHILVFGTVQVLFIYSTCTIYILHKVIWAILPLHTQITTVAPCQTPESTGCPSTADFFFFFLCNCSSGFTLIYCICPHGFFWCQFSLVNAKGIKAILVFPWICAYGYANTFHRQTGQQ